MTLPIALDAMGGDFAPESVITGARRAVDELGLHVILVGPPDRVGDTRGLELVPCTQVIEMDESATAVRTKKDSSLVRAAELVRDGTASAMVSAGNTGATMSAALLRMGRLPGVIRPCIATPLPNPGRAPTVLADAGANAECTPEMLVQFALMASAFTHARYGVGAPSVGLLSIGEESSKGTPLVKAAHELLAAHAGLHFVGNVEGRDLVPAPVDVVITDGFSGNVALKTLEGSLQFIFSLILKVIGTDEVTQTAGDALLPYLLDAAGELTPEAHGGALLLGLDGICVISHGSSNDTAVMNALRVAAEMSDAQVVTAIRHAIRPDQG